MWGRSILSLMGETYYNQKPKDFYGEGTSPKQYGEWLARSKKKKKAKRRGKR